MLWHTQERQAWLAFTRIERPSLPWWGQGRLLSHEQNLFLQTSKSKRNYISTFQVSILSFRIFRSSAVPDDNWRMYKRLGKLPYWPSLELRGLFLPWGLRPSSKPSVQEPFQRPFQSWHGKFRFSFSLGKLRSHARAPFLFTFLSHTCISVIE